jgi:hypothetical protein
VGQPLSSSFSINKLVDCSTKIDHITTLNTCIMSTTESPSSLPGAAQEIPSAGNGTNDTNDTNSREPRESRDDETVSESSPGHGEVKLWQWVLQPDDDEAHPDHESGSGSEADTGAGAGVWERVGQDGVGTMLVELGVFEDSDDTSDADEASGTDCESDMLELLPGLNERERLWLLRSDTEASLSVVHALVEAGQPERLSAYSEALIKLAGGETSPEEVLGDLVVRTMQLGEGSQVNSEAMRPSGRGSTGMSRKGKVMLALAAAMLATSAINGYNDSITSSASPAQAADLSSVQTQEKP